MPIYAYRCADCGHTKDVLQKLSDPVLTTCPSCGAGAFQKQLTAAGFQLKGSGWYATDFKGVNGGAPNAADTPAPAVHARLRAGAYEPSRTLRNRPGLGVIIRVAGLLLTGRFAANVVGQWWLHQGSRLLSNIPIVKSIYSSVKQVSDTLFSSSGQAF